jgi:hypothetical protein
MEAWHARRKDALPPHAPEDPAAEVLGTGPGLS